MSDVCEALIVFSVYSVFSVDFHKNFRVLSCYSWFPLFLLSALSFRLLAPRSGLYLLLAFSFWLSAPRSGLPLLSALSFKLLAKYELVKWIQKK